MSWSERALQAFQDHLVAHGPEEAITAFSLAFLLILLLFLKGRVDKAIEGRKKRIPVYLAFLSDLVFSLLYILGVELAKLFMRGPLSLDLFSAVAYFTAGSLIIRNLLAILDIRAAIWRIAAYVLLALSVLSFLVRDISERLLPTVFERGDAFLAFKVSLLLLIYIFLFVGLRSKVALIPERYGLLRRILEILLPLMSLVYLVVAALWIIQVIHLAPSFLIGLILTLIALVAYSLLRISFVQTVRPRLEQQRVPFPGLEKNIYLLLTLALMAALYHVALAFFGLAVVMDILKGLYLIQTGVVNISVLTLLAAAYTFVLLLSIINILKQLLYFLMVSRNRDTEAGSIRSLVFKLGILIIVITCLSILGFSWKALLPLAGALGIGIGFGLQSIMNNYISGFVLLFSRKLKSGDVVELQGQAGRTIGNNSEIIYGRVISVDVLSTLVATPDGIEVVIPNSQFLTQQIVNYSLSNSQVRLRVPFGVSYASDPHTVREILLRVAAQHDQILKSPTAQVWFSQMADSSLIFTLLVWINVRTAWRIPPLISEIYFKAWYALKEGGVEIPFPQRDVWFRNKLELGGTSTTTIRDDGDVDDPR